MFVVRCIFSQSASTLKSGDTGMTLNFWQRVIKDGQVNFIHRIFRKYQGSGKDVNVCVCSGGTSTDSTKIKEDIFC